ncbi:MAG: hypothetical protein U9P49_02940 [Thermodesulfobacteriota bacterium]|nr:hypothetical protein [Thermodesulfobacteriota bacterium]
MFVGFFYELRDQGVPITPKAFLRLQEALGMGLICSLDDFYTVARSLMVKSEKYFDAYDKVFAHYFQGAQLQSPLQEEIDKMVQALLNEWLKDPKLMADFLGVDEDELEKMTPEELEEYFRKRLKEQTERHDGGSKWIGTGGTSPVGHSGYHPGGMRVGGSSRGQSAIKVALERRYRDYTQDTCLGPSQISEALRRFRNMIPVGPMDHVNVEKTIYETMRNAGEIEIVFDRSLKDKLKVVLMIDNGGWSMDPYVDVVQVLFNYARAQFKDLKIFYFHNAIYNKVWEDPTRYYKPYEVDDFIRLDPESRVIIVGDASMATYELLSQHGNIYYNSPQVLSSIKRLEFLAKTFKHSVWINPKLAHTWHHTETVEIIMEVFPMFELTLNGLEKAVAYLMKRY